MSLSYKIERIVAEHHQILLSLKDSEGWEGAELADQSGASANEGVGGGVMYADDPLLVKIAVSPQYNSQHSGAFE